MSSTVSFNQWSLPSLGVVESVDPRLTWPLAGSFVLHVMVVCVAILGVRFLPAVESPEAFYHVALVTLPDRRSPQLTTSRAAEPRAPATLPDRRSPRVASPEPSVQQPAPIVRTTVVPEQFEPSVSHAAMPLKVPQLAALEPGLQKQETPIRHATEENRIAESLTQMIDDSVQIPEVRKPRLANVISVSPPQAPGPVPHKTEDRIRARSPKTSNVLPPPPSLARVSIGRDPMPSQVFPPVPVSKSERVRRKRGLDNLAIPKMSVPRTKVSAPRSLRPPPPLNVPDLALPKAPDPRTLNIADPALPKGPAPAARQPVLNAAVSGVQAAPTTLQVEGSVEGSSPDESRYWDQIEKEIHGHWPYMFRPRDRPTRVVLAFRVGRTGQIEGLTIEQSSGNEAYDSMAKRAVTAASPFPPFPSTITGDYRDIHFAFNNFQRS